MLGVMRDGEGGGGDPRCYSDGEKRSDRDA